MLPSSYHVISFNVKWYLLGHRSPVYGALPHVAEYGFAVIGVYLYKRV